MSVHACNVSVSTVIANNNGLCSYPCVPGIHTQEQTDAWKPIVKVQPFAKQAFLQEFALSGIWLELRSKLLVLLHLLLQGVHDKGGVFFLQLWHVGRSSHPGPSSDAMLILKLQSWQSLLQLPRLWHVAIIQYCYTLYSIASYPGAKV